MSEKNIDYEHPDYTQNVNTWVKNRDCYKGDKAIKDKGEIYLPKLTGLSEDEYETYKQRGLFVNYVKLTADGMIGQIMRKDPTVEGLNLDTDNIDGSGGTIYNLFRRTTKELITVGRTGLFVDYYTTDAENVIEAELKGEKAYITSWNAEAIINWRTTVVNGENKLSLLVLKEVILDYSQDEFEPEQKEIYKVLKLTEGIYTQEEYKKVQDSITGEKSFLLVSDPVTPLLNGKPLDFIPFWIVNTYGTGTEIEESSINDLCDINVSHYLNTCDNENELFWCSVKTPIFPGWDTDKPIVIGRAQSVDGGKDSALPYILEAKNKSAISEEMTKKEQRMSAIGSSLITGRGRYIASAETSRIQSSSETSILSHISNILSDAFTQALTFWSLWSGGSEDIQVSFNKDFMEETLDTKKAVELSTLVETGYLSRKAYFYNMKKGEYYPTEWTYDDEQKEIEQDMENKIIGFESMSVVQNNLNQDGEEN